MRLCCSDGWRLTTRLVSLAAPDDFIASTTLARGGSRSFRISTRHRPNWLNLHDLEALLRLLRLRF